MLTHTSLYARHLSRALERRDWGVADQATRFLLVRAMGRDPLANNVDPQDIACLPSGLLLDVDARWRACSDGALGFAAQVRLWRELGGVARVLVFKQMSAEDKRGLGAVERRFAARVGWVSEGVWTGPTCVGEVPEGALPYSPLCCSYGKGLVGLNLAALASRLT